MVPYNAAFFGLYENVFNVLRDEFGEDRALQLFRNVLERGLKKAYDAMGFEKGSPNDFARVVGERDAGVGLVVKFPTISDTQIVYQFHTDPFPNLKGLVGPHKRDATYMDFKVSYLLGKPWAYTTTRHIWKGDPYTEHLIRKG